MNILFTPLQHSLYLLTKVHNIGYLCSMLIQKPLYRSVEWFLYKHTAQYNMYIFTTLAVLPLNPDALSLFVH